MTPHKQRFHHQPAEGVWGDCARTALACLLDIEPEQVPHHHRPMGVGEQQGEFRSWLKDRGLGIAFFAFPCPIEDVFAVMKTCNPGIHYMLSGFSRTGCNHVVVALEDEIIHDPSLTDAGIVGPCDDGHYYVELLVRLDRQNSDA